MYEVTVESRFPASHAVRMFSGELEPCHSHEWEVRAVFSGWQLLDNGVLVDFAKVRERLNQILEPLNGADLNEHPFLEGRPSSAENMARRIFELLSLSNWQEGRLSKVIVREAPGCTASYVAE